LKHFIKNGKISFICVIIFKLSEIYEEIKVIGKGNFGKT